jgi:hypothetical protein
LVPEAETLRLKEYPGQVDPPVGPVMLGTEYNDTVAAELVAEHPLLLVTTQ